MNEFFRRLAHWTANPVGSAWTFTGAVLLIFVQGREGKRNDERKRVNGTVKVQPRHLQSMFKSNGSRA